MAIKKYKPTTNGRRGMSTLANEELTTSTPTKSLLKKLVRLEDVTIKVNLLFVILVEELKENIVLSILREIRLV